MNYYHYYLLVMLAAPLVMYSTPATYRASAHHDRAGERTVQPLSLQEEIVWWAPQMSEHALFLYLGLNKAKVPYLKHQGRELHEELEDFIETFVSPRSGISTKFCKMPQGLTYYKHLLHKLRSYKEAALDATLHGWVGDLYPSLIRHMIHELDYHRENLDGAERSLREELAFWSQHNAEVAHVAAHLLDPAEQTLIEQARALARKFERAHEQREQEQSFINLTLNANKELDAYGKKLKLGIQKHEIQSIIDPVLLNHEARENAYAMKRLFGKSSH
jgi:hypothetical protein